MISWMSLTGLKLFPLRSVGSAGSEGACSEAVCSDAAWSAEALTAIGRADLNRELRKGAGLRIA